MTKPRQPPQRTKIEDVEFKFPSLGQTDGASDDEKHTYEIPKLALLGGTVGLDAGKERIQSYSHIPCSLQRLKCPLMAAIGRRRTAEVKASSGTEPAHRHLLCARGRQKCLQLCLAIARVICPKPRGSSGLVSGAGRRVESQAQQHEGTAWIALRPGGHVETAYFVPT